MATLLNPGQVIEMNHPFPFRELVTPILGVRDAPRPEAVDGMRASSANPPGDTAEIHNPVLKARQFLDKITNL